MALPKIWLDALAGARVCASPADAERSIKRLHRLSGLALRESAVLFAVFKSKYERTDIKLLERTLSVNSPAIYFTADGLSLKGLVRIDKDFATFLTLTEKGRVLVDRCLS